MKLTEIAIEGNTQTVSYQLGTFDPGLNFVYGENGAGKSTVCSFLQSTLLTNGHTHVPVTGRANVVTSRGAFELQNRTGAASGATVKPIGTSEFDSRCASVVSVSQLSEGMTPELYNTFYNFGLRDAMTQRFEIARLLHDRLGVPAGPEAADPTARVDHQPEMDRLESELAQLRISIDALHAMRSRIVDDIAAQQADDQSRRADLTQRVDQLAYQLSQFDPATIRSQIALVEQEMVSLQATIDQASATYVTQPTATPAVDSFKMLYQRLDEVDQQIVRWRQVQTDVQHQRVRLKDEMVVWNEMTLESDDHPYHNAREILIGLESHVDHAEQTARRWDDNTVSQIDVAQMAKAVEELCQHMRDDLYALCGELSSQYKHIRQRSAAVELKQLRRCYHEMGENTARLVQRRQQVIDEIRAIDPAGAEAIVRSEQAFCQCAAHEGYLAARRRYLGDVSTAAPAVTRVEPDLTAERRRLVELQSDRNALTAQLNQTEADYAERQRQHSALVQELEALAGYDVAALHEQLNRMDADLRNKESANLDVQGRIDALRALPLVQAHSVLVHAGQLLHRMTQGDLTQAFLSHHSGTSNDPRHAFDLQIRDSLGRVHNFTGLDQAAQNHVCLSLALAVVAALKESSVARESSISLPMVIDDSFVHIGPSHVDSTLATLDGFCRQHDQQIILLSQHRYLADRLPSMPVFELPPTRPAAVPHPAPLRSQPIPARPSPVQPLPPRTIQTALASEDTLPLPAARRQAAHNRPYPLSKYSVNPAAEFSATELPPAETTDDYRLPWSPLNRQAAAVAPAASRNQVQPMSPRSFAADQGRTTEVTIDSTPLESLGLFSLQRQGELHDCGVTTIEQLLDLDTGQLSDAFQECGITIRKIEKWQAQAWLLRSISGLLADEARLLVASGIRDLDAMFDSDAGRLLARIRQFLASADGQRFRQRRSSRDWSNLSLDEVARWHRSLSSSRSQWSSRRNRSGRSQRTRSNNWRDTNPRSSDSRSRDQRARTYSVGNYPRRERMGHGDAGSTDRSYQRAESTRDGRGSAEPRSARSTSRSETRKSEEKLRFYLDLSDDLEAAPSIGPKTAERFQKIGVITVADFLRQTAESMATRLDYKRLSADVLQTWQQQTRMVCRIPNLRGHDAQLLVACEVIEPEELATMHPETLFEVIGPFAETKEGLKIIRSGKKPDLAEVTDWINWAKHTRSLQAA